MIKHFEWQKNLRMNELYMNELVVVWMNDRKRINK